MESRGLIKRVADTRNNIIIKRSIITPKGTNIFKMGHKEFLKIKEKIQENFQKKKWNNSSTIWENSDELFLQSLMLN